MKKFILTTLLFSFLTLSLQAQITNLLPKFVRNMYFSNDTARHNSFVILPVLTSAPETGIEGGAAALYSFYSDKNPDTRVSNIFPYATITTKGQTKFSISSSYWTSQNEWHYTATINYINYPFDFFGIGNNTLKSSEDNVVEKRLRIRATAEKKIADNLYAGLVGGASHYHFTDSDPTGIFNTSTSVDDRTGGSQLFVGPTLIYDSRNNNTYTTSGILVESHYDMIKGIFINNAYAGGFFNIEYSQYFLLAKPLVLGVDIQEQSITGGQSPFYLLPSLGSDEMMRGYYNGRYRDRNLIAGQTELRYRFSKRVGVVGFVGTGEVAHNAFSLNQLKPNYGGGLRYFFDIQKGLSVRMDYGVGEKVPGEARQTGFYIGLGEAF